MPISKENTKLHGSTHRKSRPSSSSILSKITKRSSSLSPSSSSSSSTKLYYNQEPQQYYIPTNGSTTNRTTSPSSIDSLVSAPESDNYSVTSRSSKKSVFSQNSRASSLATTISSKSSNGSRRSSHSSHISGKKNHIRSPSVISSSGSSSISGISNGFDYSPTSAPYKTDYTATNTNFVTNGTPGFDYDSQNIVIVELSSMLNHISLSQSNIGNEVFKQLNAVVNKYRSLVEEKKKSDAIKGSEMESNCPDKLIDWNLNLMRLLMFLNVDELPEGYKNKQIYVRISESKAVNNITSELVRLNKTTIDAGHKKLLQHVFNYGAWCEEENFKARNSSYKEPEILLKVEKVDYKNTMDSQEFLSQLVNCDLFKEFQIDPNYKRLVASISISNSIHLKKDHKDNKNVNYKELALRNYFLNLIVAAQTLFEFRYSELKGLICIDKLNANDKKVVWEKIRERNFNKINMF
ncbi:unnamed protein product [Ambrosiozyma monospora]|uniref:Unnamed protein product n=1 Tax=Ambrosiozyma monospora TaxID=43982 RepID=A0ACB5TD22_AMBMO|nr:unnamed protein product [Ambrosiozyma monospora]